MAESPSGYFPDFTIQPVPAYDKAYDTEIERARNGREQRRPRANPQRFLAMETLPLSQANRKIIFDFLDSKQGAYQSFFFFTPVPESLAIYNVGSVTAATSIVLPWKGPWWIGETPVAATITAATVGGAPPTAPSATPNIGSGGEDRLSWTGAMSGVVLVTVELARPRWIVRNNDDHLRQTFDERAAEALAIFPLSFLELVT